MDSAYNALKHVIETELGLTENSSQDVCDELTVASTHNPSMWGFAIEPDGSWANLWYPGNLVDLAAWVGVMKRTHPKARYFRWNGSAIVEDEGPSPFFTHLFYDMLPHQEEK